MESPLTDALYEILLDAINAGVWVWNIETGEEWWSDRYYKLLGYEPNEIKASYNTFLYKLVHPDDMHLLIDENKKPIFISVGSPVEVRLKLKDGSYQWYEACGKLIFDDDNKPVKMVGSIINRNRSRTLQQKLEHSINIITEQNKRLNNFAHIVSHNLRSHAANMQGILSMITLPGESDIELNDCLLTLNKISAGLNQTINHLGEVIQFETAVKPASTAIQFKEVFDTVINVLTPAIKNSNAIIYTDFSACTHVDYVPAYLESIFLNLLSNALKYSHPDRAPLIRIRTFINNGKACMEITDNGLGIDLIKNGDKLFGLYNVFNNRPDSKGIGLYITKNQVESLGGKITATSELGEGCCFLIQF